MCLKAYLSRPNHKKEKNIMRYLEDYELGKTHCLGSYQLRSPDIINFADQYDPQYYHLNPEQAKHSRFGGLIASGWQVAAVWMKLYVETMLQNAAVEGSPGVKDISWLEPVKPGVLLSGTVTITRVCPSMSRQDCGILENFGVLMDREGNPVMQLVLYSLFRKRPAKH